MTASQMKKYAKLNDIEFLGYQERRSKAEIRKDDARTARFINAYKARKKAASTTEKGIL